MPISEEKFKTALSDKHIPVLILDNEWHKLFKRSGTTPEIEALEKEAGKKCCIELLPYKNFYRAEEYHQDYDLKNPEEFRQELVSSGRIRD